MGVVGLCFDKTVIRTKTCLTTVSAITVRRIKDSDQLAVVAAGLNKFWSETLFYRCNMSSKYWVKRVWSPSAVRERHHGART